MSKPVVRISTTGAESLRCRYAPVAPGADEDIDRIRGLERPRVFEGVRQVLVDHVDVGGLVVLLYDLVHLARETAR
jgi:hypothetical protein